METFSALWLFLIGIQWIPVIKGPAMQIFAVSWNKLLKKQLICQLFKV